MKIVIEKPSRATTIISEELDAKLVKQLAGDIENWLLSKKGIICEVSIEDEY